MAIVGPLPATSPLERYVLWSGYSNILFKIASPAATLEGIRDFLMNVFGEGLKNGNFPNLIL